MTFEKKHKRAGEVPISEQFVVHFCCFVLYERSKLGVKKAIQAKSNSSKRNRLSNLLLYIGHVNEYVGCGIQFARPCPVHLCMI